jgi:hypothetical protein
MALRAAAPVLAQPRRLAAAPRLSPRSVLAVRARLALVGSLGAPAAPGGGLTESALGGAMLVATPLIDLAVSVSAAPRSDILDTVTFAADTSPGGDGASASGDGPGAPGDGGAAPGDGGGGDGAPSGDGGTGGVGGGSGENG